MIRVLSQKRMAPFLNRHMQFKFKDRDLRLDTFLRLALEKANQFVPSEAGSIFLDDPSTKRRDRGKYRERHWLAAVASFGPKSKATLGKKVAATQGVVGHVYVSGQAYFSPELSKDPRFSSAEHRHGDTSSVLCVPIFIRDSVVGVLELSDKLGKKSYTDADFELLQIFAGYISASIQNFLDAKRNAAMALQDNLTGLANDRHLHALLRREVLKAWKSKSELSILFMDLDHFKAVNDEYGHLAGSRLLAEVAEVLSSVIRVPRARLARYGGDEYVAILPGVNQKDALAIAEEARDAIARKVFLRDASAEVPALKIADQITVSIGVACLLTHVGTPDAHKLLRAADQAMYLAKRSGKNQVCVASPIKG
jgi:diguanylate cyclase (GGDEF)-like protein